MNHTDIKTEGFISQLPYSWQPYAILMRLDRPIGWWLLLLPGWWAITLSAGGVSGMNGHSWFLMALFFIGAVIMRGAGCTINDLWDRNLDKQVERTRNRPIASGAVSVPQALAFLFALLFTGLIILLQTSAVTIGLGFLSMIFVAAYPYMKRITWWPQAFLGITFNFGVLMGWGAVAHSLEPPVFTLYLGAFFWTLGYDTIYAHQDKEDDQIVGIKSTALLFGARSKKWVSGFYAAAWVLMTLSVYLTSQSLIAAAFMLPAAAHLVWQIMRWESDDQPSSLKTFKSNRDFGLLVLLACLLSFL